MTSATIDAEMHGRTQREKEASGEGWLVGGGEMGKLIRSMDWAATPLGPIASWPIRGCS